ncbi:MAG: ABC transporter permease subunit [Bacillota bacterium]|nr:ABC transporter permease subunit [Bacillota bacterium]
MNLPTIPDNQSLKYREPKPVSKKLISKLLAQKYLFLMLLPGLIWYIIFAYIPMPGVIIAFKEYSLSKGFFNSPWAGFKYFDQFFNGFFFWALIRNTVVLSLLKLCIGFPAPIILALLFNELHHAKFKRTIQTISYLPHFISWVIVLGIFFRILSTDGGIFNRLLMNFGIAEKPINFLSTSKYIWPIAVFTDLWKSVGYSSIIYLASISNVNPELYEASMIDGAGRLKQAVHITLPVIRPTIAILFIFASGGIFSSNFDQMYILGSPPVLDVAEVIDTYIYRIGLQNLQYSLSTAASLLRSVISLLLLIGTNMVVKAMGEGGIW